MLTILNPFAVRDLGLIMSLMATLGMIVLSARMESWMIRPFANVKRGRRIINGIVATVAQSLSASLFLLPITIVVFERVSLISPVTNVLCMLPASIMMIASGVGSMLHSMGMLAFISNPCPVSYTHLDVYKRQGHWIRSWICWCKTTSATGKA